MNKAQNDATNLAQTHSKAFNPHNTKIIYSDSGNEILCATALECLNNIILASGFCLKPVQHKTLHENIVAIAIGTVESAPQRNHLYYSTECRGKLYDALHALVVSPHHLCPPPVQYANAVFSVGQLTDPNHSVRDKCAFYLRVIEKILHPQKETLAFPLDANEVADAFKKQDQNGELVDSDSSSSDDEVKWTIFDSEFTFYSNEIFRINRTSLSHEQRSQTITMEMVFNHQPKLFQQSIKQHCSKIMRLP